MSTKIDKKAVTLKDIAAVCNVSINTVSHALNGKSDISEETRDLITETALKMGYIGNSIARSMRSGKTNTVTLIISDISNPLFSIMAKEIESILSIKDYVLFIMNTMSSPEKEYKAVVSAIERGTDGVILCPNQSDHKAIDLLERHGIPYILFGRRFSDDNSDYVIWNDELGGFLATEHLIRKGHRRILYLGSEPQISGTQERLNGYKKALTENGLAIDEKLIYTGKSTMADTEQVIRKCLNGIDGFTALFAFSDYIASDAKKVLKQIDRDLAKKIDVVGFDDLQAEITFPLDISSVHTPKKEMAEALVEGLFHSMKNGAAHLPIHSVIDPTLTVR